MNLIFCTREFNNVTTLDIKVADAYSGIYVSVDNATQIVVIDKFGNTFDTFQSKTAIIPNIGEMNLVFDTETNVYIKPL